MVGSKCCFIHCENKWRNTTGVSFLGFPKEECLRQLWISKVRRPGWTLYKNSKLCSDHFTEDCFELGSRLKQEFGLSRPGKRPALTLKCDAIPTIFNDREGAMTTEASLSPQEGCEERRNRAADSSEEAMPLAEAPPEVPSTSPAREAVPSVAHLPVDLVQSVYMESPGALLPSALISSQQSDRGVTTVQPLAPDSMRTGARPSVCDAATQTDISITGDTARIVIVEVPKVPPTGASAEARMSATSVDEPSNVSQLPEDGFAVAGPSGYQPTRSSTPLVDEGSPDSVQNFFASGGQDLADTSLDEPHSVSWKRSFLLPTVVFHPTRV
ncbi:peroxynitrite isomerase THAP4-like [Ornithodoros turicata]|uniref:peroxynitrite isomerase THAP4-like n=1 Tax=Ornithodoros turicata TaxID=34597 RepID=UPI003138EF63